MTIDLITIAVDLWTQAAAAAAALMCISYDPRT